MSLLYVYYAQNFYGQRKLEKEIEYAICNNAWSDVMRHGDESSSEEVLS